MNPYRTSEAKENGFKGEVFTYEKQHNNAIVEFRYEGVGGKLQIAQHEYKYEQNHTECNEYGIILVSGRGPYVTDGRHAFISETWRWEKLNCVSFRNDDKKILIPWSRIFSIELVEIININVKFDWTWKIKSG